MLIERPSAITVHGLGLGGGEVVAEKLMTLYSGCLLIGHQAGQLAMLRNVILTRSKGRLLCTAGPRDLPVLILCLLLRKRANVYLQVPYRQSLTIQDFPHFTGTLLFLLAASFLTKNILVNSGNTANSVLLRSSTLVLPIMRHQIPLPEASFNNERDYFNQECLRLNIVCRLISERGRGSRDERAIGRLAREVNDYRLHTGIPASIHHFGECDVPMRQAIESIAPNCISFHGFQRDWLLLSSGPLVFLSKYEGFGLAALEGAKAGRMVFVNEAFPDELLALSLKLVRIRSCENILQQILDALTNYPRHK